jgi:hypothetical protein
MFESEKSLDEQAKQNYYNQMLECIRMAEENAMNERYEAESFYIQKLERLVREYKKAIA